jgi:hypothetical protein
MKRDVLPVIAFSSSRNHDPADIPDTGLLFVDCRKACSTLRRSILHDKINQAVWYCYFLDDLLSLNKGCDTWISTNRPNEISG